MMPDGKPKGAVVLLHGLTDTPTACGISLKITGNRGMSPSVSDYRAMGRFPPG